MRISRKVPKTIPVNLGGLAITGCILAAALVMPLHNLAQAPAPTPTAPQPSQSAPLVDRPPAGWYVAGSKPAFYHAGIEPNLLHEGKPCAFFSATVAKVEGFGTLMQTIAAADYTGKRMRLRAWAKSQDLDGWAGVWMRVDKGKSVVAFDNMQARPIHATTDWKSYDVVLDVPQDATEISYGALLSGGGEMWISNVSFEPVGKDVAITAEKSPDPPRFPNHPINLDFAQ